MLYEVITILLRPARADRLVERDGDRSRRGVAVTVDVDEDLLHVHPQKLRHHLDDPEVRLVGHDEVRITSYNVCYTKLLRVRHRRADDPSATVEILMTATPLVERGKFLGLIITGVDITDLTDAQRELEQTAETLRARTEELESYNFV